METVFLTPARSWAMAQLLSALALGCGSMGHDYSLPVGSDDGGSGGFLGEDSSAGGAFDAHIEQDHVTVTIVTVGCAGACAEVQAVATGGAPPYSFSWSDGSTSAARQVCPTADTHYDVTVSDTGRTGEFPQPPQAVKVPLTASVLACPDAGAGEEAGMPETGFHWVHWTSSQTTGNPGSATGTLLPASGPITVKYTGEVYQPLLPTPPTDYFVPATTYTCATVGNKPTQADGLVLQQGGTPTVDTLTFSRPVTNPVLAIMSLGNSQDGTTCSYQFGVYGESFTILQQGMGEMAGPGTLVEDANGGLTGNDGDGLVQLNGTFSTVKWTDPDVACEGFGDHGFTIGIAGP
jgi:hypothetical protein